jgi:hypothetical protein
MVDSFVTLFLQREGVSAAVVTVGYQAGFPATSWIGMRLHASVCVGLDLCCSVFGSEWIRLGGDGMMELYPEPRGECTP